MIPSWLTTNDDYKVSKSSNRFIYKTIGTIGNILSRLAIQKGHEKTHALNPLLKLIFTIILILIISITRNLLIILIISAVLLLYLSSWPAKDILSILRTSLLACLLSLIILLPSIIINHNIYNSLLIIIKVFLDVTSLSIFNHTTTWNHVTTSLRRLHVPSIFIFTLDTTLKYIVILGNMINDLLVSLKLRSVGKNNKKYNSIGGIMGHTFIKSSEYAKEMYDAMICRCFDDNYERINK